MAVNRTETALIIGWGFDAGSAVGSETKTNKKGIVDDKTKL